MKNIILSILFVAVYIVWIFIYADYDGKKDFKALKEERVSIVNPNIAEPDGSVLEEVDRSFQLPSFVKHDVPFSSQAPFGNWEDPKQQNGCEEASALMAIRWVKNENLTPEEARKEIISMSDYQLKQYGYFHDSSAEDTVKRIFNEYFHYYNVALKYGITESDIKRELAEGKVILAPINGRTIGNPYYTPPGPLRHMILIIGFDEEKRQFISHDPATQSGKAIRFEYDFLMSSLQAYESGYLQPPLKKPTVIITVSK